MTKRQTRKAIYQSIVKEGKSHQETFDELRSTSEFDLELIQNSGVFQIYNAVEGIIALAWEKLEDGGDYPEERLVFKFGESQKSVEEKLYSIDLVLNYDDFKVRK